MNIPWFGQTHDISSRSTTFNKFSSLTSVQKSITKLYIIWIIKFETFKVTNLSENN